MRITEEIQVINNEPFPPEASCLAALPTMYSNVYIYVCFVTTELLCRQSRVPRSSVQLANRAIYLYDNRDPINQAKGVFSFLSFISSLPLSLMASSQKFLQVNPCLLYTSPSPRDKRQSRMPSSA